MFNLWGIKKNEDETYSVVGVITDGTLPRGASRGARSDNTMMITDFSMLEVYDDNGELKVREHVSKKSDEEKRKKGELKENLCLDCLRFIIGYNEDIKNVTQQQTQDTYAAFSSIMGLLRSGGLETSRGLIATVDIIGTIYDESDRLNILNYMDEKILVYQKTYPIE